jgi:SAM-dependent methyltransferase
MQSSRFVSLSQAVFLLALSTASSGALGQQPSSDFQPRVGQHGKDVIWVPTPQTLVDKMLEVAKVTPQDFVVDLGSGDGRTVISAAKLGATALGIEYNPDMVELSRRNAAQAGVSGKATFTKADIFATDFPNATAVTTFVLPGNAPAAIAGDPASPTVVTMFLLPGLNLKLRPTILNMKPGTRVVSNSFDMGDWQADQTVRATTDCTGYCRAFLWIVPAQVEGTWQLGESQLSLQQKYQYFTGKLATGNVVAPITDGKLEADRITFTAGGTRYTGQVRGGTMEGTSTSGGTEAKWQAARR